MFHFEYNSSTDFFQWRGATGISHLGGFPLFKVQAQVAKKTEHLLIQNYSLEVYGSLTYPLKNGGWKTSFLLGFGNFSGAMLNVRRVYMAIV